MIIENVNKIEREDDLWTPQVIGDIPDDLFYAPEAGLEYTYQVVGPDGINIDYDINMDVSTLELKAKSYEYNGEYYWAYLQKAEYREWADPEDFEKAGVWVSTDRCYFNLAYYFDRYIGGVESVEKNIEDQSTKVTFWFQPIITPFTVWEEEGEEPIITGTPSRIEVEEHLSLVIDGVEVYHRTYDRFFSDEREPDYNQLYSDKHYISTTIPADSGQNYSELIVDSSENRANASAPYEDYYRYAPLTPFKKNFVANFENEATINVSFDETLNSEYFVPYKYEPNTEVATYERYSFTKSFDNMYKYPTTTKELMRMEYTDFAAEPELILPSKIDAKISLEGYDDQNITVKTKKVIGERNKYIFYVDDEMYYDQKSGEVFDGRSSGSNNFTEYGIVLPWDIENEGKIEFSFSVDTYRTNYFNIELRIGNENTLRGKDGKYEIVEVMDEK